MSDEPEIAIGTLREEIRDMILHQLDVTIADPKLLTYEAPLYGEKSAFAFDSVVLLDLMLIIEEKYDIAFEDDNVALGRTFQDIITIADYTHNRIRWFRSQGLRNELLAAPEGDSGESAQPAPPGTDKSSSGPANP